MFRMNYCIILCVLACFAVPTPVCLGLEWSSYIFTTADIIFFSYEDNTQVEIYDVSNQLVWPISQPVILNAGEHARITYPTITGNTVYKVTGSKKFAVLTGDPATNGVSGYYAMDANGLGASTEFYTYVPYKDTTLIGTQQFIVFAYQDNTQVTVQQDVSGVYHNVDTFTLDKGRHWANPNLSGKYIHVVADKPVSALTCHDQGYFVPSANGKWSGTEFYTYVGDVGKYNDGSWMQDLTVIAFDDDTSVTIKDSNDPNIVIWSGVLNAGKAKPIKCSAQEGGLNRYYTITSDKTVTVSVQPWVNCTHAHYQGVFIPDRDGTGVGRLGRELIGSTMDGDEAYLYILAHTDNTYVDLYNSQNGDWIAGYSLNEGDCCDINPGNGLWKIVSKGFVSAYSGCGGSYAAEFAPLTFNSKFVFPFLTLAKDDNGVDCVEPHNTLYYNITYDANGYGDTNVVITDYLPEEVDYVSSTPDGNYSDTFHTVTWDIGTLSPGESNSVTLTVKVNEGAAPNGIIRNYCEIESDRYCSFATEDTNVCYWQPDSEIIYVDRLSPCAPGTGMSWRFAYRDLQDALARARTGNEIWVAKGTYKPTIEPNSLATFQLVNDVPIYGGFPSGGGQQRNWMINETILDGRISQNASVQYVVTADSIEDAIIDGFTIRGSYDDYGEGAGINLDDANVTVVNCKFIDNYSHGIDCNHSQPVITNSTFDGSNITQSAIRAVSSSDVNLAGCVVKNHTSDGISVSDSNIEINRSVIEHNSSCGFTVCLVLRLPLLTV